MAAGLGFKTFTTGEVLTAADTNGYLMQGVLVFASSAARAASITSPQEGQYSYLKDTNSTEYYDGAAWIAAPIGDITGVTAGVGITGGGTSGTVTITNDMATTITAAGDIVVGTGSGTYDNLPIGTTAQVLTADTTVSPYKVKWATPATVSSGLTLINRSTFSNVASHTIDSVFSSTYKSYLVSIEALSASTTADDLCLRFRYGSSTENATSYYGNAINATYNSGTVANYPTNGLTLIALTSSSGTSTNPCVGLLEINRVGNASEAPGVTGNLVDPAAVTMFNVGSTTITSRTYTGLQFFSSSSNITGAISVYGLAI
jgi:hypothetical protein